MTKNSYLSKLIDIVKSIPSRFYKKFTHVSIRDGISKEAKNQEKHIEILFYFIGLAAQLSEIDGPTNQHELDKIVTIFPNFLNARQKVINLYNSALDETKKGVNFADKIKTSVSGKNKLFEDLCMKLIIIADADAPINNIEFNFIVEIARKLGYNSQNVEKWIMDYIQNNEFTDYEILGISHIDNIKSISEAYRERVIKFHPDKLLGDIAEIYKTACKKKYEALNNAYRNLKS
jgi:hypothetical protein